MDKAAVGPLRHARLTRACVVLCLAASALLAAWPAGAAAGPTVAIVNFHFTPTPITVQVGQTVTWTNEGFVSHTVTAVSGEFDSGTIRGGGHYSMTFSKPGTFAYKCTIHPQMRGSVIVEGHNMSFEPGMSPHTMPMPTPPTHEVTGNATGVSLALEHGRHRTRLTVIASPPGARVLLELYSREHFAWIQVAHGTLNAEGRAYFSLKAALDRPARAVVLNTSVPGAAPLISPTLRT
jgi:plastocyanin